MNEEFVYISDPKDVAVLVRNEGKFPCRPNLEALTESRLQQGLPVGVTNMQGKILFIIFIFNLIDNEKTYNHCLKLFYLTN